MLRLNEITHLKTCQILNETTGLSISFTGKSSPGSQVEVFHITYSLILLAGDWTETYCKWSRCSTTKPSPSPKEYVLSIFFFCTISGYFETQLFPVEALTCWYKYIQMNEIGTLHYCCIWTKVTHNEQCSTLGNVTWISNSTNTSLEWCLLT